MGNARGQLAYVVKVLVFRDQRIEHQSTHTFAGRVDRWRAYWINRADVVAQSDYECIASVLARCRHKRSGKKKEEQETNAVRLHQIEPPYR